MRIALAATLLLLAACGYDPAGRCETRADCLDGQVCDAGLCAVPGPPPENHAPSAGPDAYAVPSSGELVCAAPCLLVNDTDPDGDRLEAHTASPPAHGVVFVAPDGSFWYLADVGYSGPDAFSYRVTDGFALTAPTPVSLTVAAP